MCVCCTFLICSTKLISKILYAKDFYAAWEYVPFLLVSSVFSASSMYIGPMLSAIKNSKAMALSAIYGSIVNIVLNILLIYILGPQGAAISTAISSYAIYASRKKAVGNLIISEKYISTMVSWIILMIQAALFIYNGQMIFQLLCIMLIVALYWKIIVNLTKTIFKFILSLRK